MLVHLFHVEQYNLAITLETYMFHVEHCCLQEKLKDIYTGPINHVFHIQI